MKQLKNERGNFTLYVVVIMLGILAFAGLFINVAGTYLSINFSKKALEESVRTRALAVDIPLKEEAGVVEVINYPYSGSNIPFNRPTSGAEGNFIPTPSDSEYISASKYAEESAKDSMVRSVNSFLGKNIQEEAIVDMQHENICFDVKPLPQNSGEVTFQCPLKTPSGKVYTVKHTAKVKGYDDAGGVNNFTDAISNNTMRVSNVVFGAAAIEPKSLITNGLTELGFKDEPETIIYSVSYPQIDKCYGEFC